jgi:maltose alpha-D-glucosyltransferase/alpha-amylase
VRNLVHLRKEHPVFGVGSLTVVRTDNASVLAFLRDMPIEGCKPGESPETLLCVYSFAHQPLSVMLSLPESFRANKVIEIMGGGSFPAPDEKGDLVLTLPPQSFYWLSLAGIKASVA